MTRIVLLLTLSAAALPAQVSPVGSHDRARNLALVTFDVRDTSVGDVLELLRRQTGHDLATPGVPEETLSRKVSIAADAEPLTTVLHKMGMTPKKDRRPSLSVATPQSLRTLPSSPVWRSVPGATFSFSTETWEGTTREVLGTILRTAATLDADGLVTWDLLHARGEGFDGIETCNWHSPEAILLTGDGGVMAGAPSRSSLRGRFGGTGPTRSCSSGRIRGRPFPSRTWRCGWSGRRSW